MERVIIALTNKQSALNRNAKYVGYAFGQVSKIRRYVKPEPGMTF